MSLINKFFGLFKKQESEEVKQAKARIAKRRQMTVEEYGEEEIARLSAGVERIDGERSVSAAQAALCKPPLTVKENEPVLSDDMSPDLYVPWAAYDLWYYWVPGPSGNSWDLRSVGPFDTHDAAAEHIKQNGNKPKFEIYEI